MRWRTLFFVFVIELVYIVIGAVVFHYIEKPSQNNLVTSTVREHMYFLSNHSCVDPKKLDLFVRAVIRAYDQGVIATANVTTDNNWDLVGSAFFSVTVITTIGYGHLAPSTKGGRAFFVFYAILGIPVFLIFLGGLGQKLQIPLKKLQKRVWLKNHRKVEENLKSFLYINVGLALLIFLPAIMFTYVEEWTYMESLYYIVVTLTTVGFGDFVPGQGDEANPVYRIFILFWIFTGLAWLAVTFTVICDDLKKRVATREEKKSKDKERKKNSVTAVSEPGK